MKILSPRGAAVALALLGLIAAGRAVPVTHADGPRPTLPTVTQPSQPRAATPTPTPVRTNTPVPTATPAPPTPTPAPPAARWVAVGPPGPVPVGAGRVELGLVNRTGQPGQQTRVTAIVSAPGGQAYDTDTTVTGNQQATVVYPNAFRGAPALRPGTYNVVWKETGGSNLAATTFEVTGPPPGPPPPRAGQGISR
ncbi:MAG: hypothetical protein K6U89_11805 [Chloroflexi bacterium]|nr:hypothetical protein [Chloroflexota bacterium]